MYLWRTGGWCAISIVPSPSPIPGPNLSPLSPSPSPSIPFPSPLPTPLPRRLDAAPTPPRRLDARPAPPPAPLRPAQAQGRSASTSSASAVGRGRCSVGPSRGCVLAAGAHRRRRRQRLQRPHRPQQRSHSTARSQGVESTAAEEPCRQPPAWSGPSPNNPAILPQDPGRCR